MCDGGMYSLNINVHNATLNVLCTQENATVQGMFEREPVYLASPT